MLLNYAILVQRDSAVMGIGVGLVLMGLFGKHLIGRGGTRLAPMPHRMRVMLVVGGGLVLLLAVGERLGWVRLG